MKVAGDIGNITRGGHMAVYAVQPTLLRANNTPPGPTVLVAFKPEARNTPS